MKDWTAVSAVPAALGEAPAFRLLGLTREAQQAGSIRGAPGAYLVALAKTQARRWKVDLGLGASP
jgi:hypothetical protein